MLYAKQISDGFQITTLSVFFPDTSFPASGPSNEWLLDSGVYPVEEHLYYDSDKYKREGCLPFLNAGIVYTAKLVELTEAEKEQLVIEKKEILGNSVREQRNRLLSESDWTQVADAPVDKEIWANYRQQLRNVSSQQGFPELVEWPVKPE